MSKHFIELQGKKKLIETKIDTKVVASVRQSIKDLKSPVLGMIVGYGGGFHTRDGKNHTKQFKLLKEKHEERLNAI
jgi:hypothetical protein